MQDDLAALERLSKTVEGIRVELRRLVEKENALMFESL
jgi:hypothetical protein